MLRFACATALGALLVLSTAASNAEPTFVNGLVIPGDSVDKTGVASANGGRVGFFSDIYYDPREQQWWALSDRGPGGGVLAYETRVQRFKIDIDRKTGAISKFKVQKTIKFSDPKGLLTPPSKADLDNPQALNGLNPAELNGNAAVLGRSFDPEGLVVSPINGHFIVSDEYGPSVYEFNRKGVLVKVFETPANLLPRLQVAPGNPGDLDFVAGRADDGIFFGRQDNRGFEGIAVSPDGKKLFAVLQDPLINEPDEPKPNDGRDGRNVRIVEFNSDRYSAGYGESTAQYAYQLEAQADIAARIKAQGGSASATDPRQGRNIGLSAIVALNDHEFLVIERDNRGLGVDDPEGKMVVGSKRVYKIDISDATDVSTLVLPGSDLAGAGIIPVTKSGVFIDFTEDTVLPNGKQPEKWEGLAIGPRLSDGARLILAGNDNDFSVTQNGSNVQFDVYVDFRGSSVQRDIDQPTKLNGVEVGPVPNGYVLIPGVLHAYKASADDLAGYVAPGKRGRECKRCEEDSDD
ncbi:MAG: esterase-like activity of phytase family protein [Burkholderiales bacterium]|nr:esterase-like activity of phytase family protein [Burkholderiales bacterium]